MDEEVKKEAKEVQQTIIPVDSMKEVKVSEEELFSILKMISPGTNLRAGLDGILKAGKGALIAVENQFLEPLIDGGFKINCRFTAQKLVELSKMDGAIVLSQDIKKINYANVLLTPDSATKTSETGTRHKAAERTAKQTGGLVIAISERKNEINIFYKNIKHYLKDTNELLRKVNEHIQLLEKQKELFENYIDRLNKMELRSTLSLNQAIQVVQKGIIIQKISKDIRKHMIELGNEGTLLKTRFKEILSGVEKETNLVVKDYTKLNLKKSKLLLDGLTYDEILDRENIYKILGYTGQKKADVIKGWRLLSKTSLHEDEIAKLVVEAGNFGKIIEGDAKLINEISSDYQLFRQKKEKLVVVTEDIKDLAQEIGEKRKEIATKAEEEKGVLSDLKERREEYEKKIAELEKSSEELTRVIQAKMAERKKSGIYAKGSGSLDWPLRGRLTSNFGYRRHPIWGGRHMHTGIDIAAPYGEVIRAADGGEVLFSGWWDGYGKAVVIDHGKSISTVYGHMSRIYVQNGNKISKGQIIGLVGSTGYSTGPHCHFEVRVNGKPKNPMGFLP